MARAKADPSTTASKEYRKPATLEAEEAEMIAMATKLAKKQLQDGTASSQVITHYLKLGTTRERLEKEILKEQKKLVQAKTHQIETSDDLKEIIENAMKAFASYQPTQDEVIEDDGY